LVPAPERFGPLKLKTIVYYLYKLLAPQTTSVQPGTQISGSGSKI